MVFITVGSSNACAADTQPTLTCQVNHRNASCFPTAFPGNILTFTFNASYAVRNSLFKFPLGIRTDFSFHIQLWLIRDTILALDHVAVNEKAQCTA